MPETRAAAELVCRGLLLLYLCWLPLPFGSVTERAQLPLIVGALVICAMAAVSVRGEWRPSPWRFAPVPLPARGERDAPQAPFASVPLPARGERVAPQAPFAPVP